MRRGGPSPDIPSPDIPMETDGRETSAFSRRLVALERLRDSSRLDANAAAAAAGDDDDDALGDRTG